jgi:hypothetical protein
MLSKNVFLEKKFFIPLEYVSGRNPAGHVLNLLISALFYAKVKL